jgi:hypothetical protein
MTINSAGGRRVVAQLGRDESWAHMRHFVTGSGCTAGTDSLQVISLRHPRRLKPSEPVDRCAGA